MFSFSLAKQRALLSVAEGAGVTVVLKNRHECSVQTVPIRETVPEYLIPKTVRG